MGKGKRHMLAPGSAAPEVPFRTAGGAVTPLAELLKAGPVLLFFYKASCPVCQFTVPFIDRMYRTPGRREIQFFAVSQDDAATAGRFVREFGVTFPVLIDDEEQGYAASNAFGISHVPSMFLIEKDGAIVWALDGFSKASLEELGRTLQAPPFLAGESVPAWKAG